MTSRYDVIVVGAGITGCVTAAELAARGFEVLVVDKDDIAYEASGRNMGAIGILGKYASDIAGASVEKWDRAASELPTPFEYQKMGRLCPAHSAEDMLILEEMRETAKDNGIKIEMLSASDVRERFPELSKDIIGAAYSAEDALVDSVAATKAYAALARGRGVHFRTGETVSRVRTRQGAVAGVELLSGEVVTAKKVLLAAGVWTTRLLDRLRIRLPMQLVCIYHGETQPIERSFDYFLRGPDYGARQMSDGVIRVTGGYRTLGAGHYLSFHDFRDMLIWIPRLIDRRKEVQFRFDPRILKSEIQASLGAAPAPRGFDPLVPQKFPRRKLAALQGVLPGVGHARIVRTIAGLVDMTADALPVLGPIERLDGLYVATGFSGQGFGLGPVVGELLAQSMSGEPTSLPLHPYRWSRFQDRKQIPVPHRLV